MALKDFFKFIKTKIDTQFSSIIPMQRFPLGASMKERKNLTEYRNWVFACIQARAEAVGAIELRLFQGEEEKDNHELLDLLYQVNPTMTMRDLFMGTQAYLDLAGDAFWFLARDKKGQGKVGEIWLLRPDAVQLVQSKDNPLLVEKYIYMNKGQRVEFMPNEMLHFKNFNPLADHPLPHRGMSVVEAAQWAIETDNEARQWNFSFFKNSARPDGLLVKKSAGVLSPEEFKRLKEQYNQEFQGSINAHKPLILSGGLEWQEIAKTQKDMDFIEQRRFSRDEILALFRVPKSVIGIVEDVNRANAEASNFVFADRTVKPLMQKIVDTLNEFLVPEFGEDLALDFVSPVPENRTEIVNEYMLGIDKWLTRNEIRQREGLPPTDRGNVIMGSLAQIPIDTSSEEIKTQKPRIKKKKVKKDEKEGIQKVISEFISKKMETLKKEQRRLPELAVKNYTEIWKQFFEIEPQAFKKELNDFLENQKQEVIANIEEETKGLEAPEYSIKAPSDFLFNETTAVRSSINIITPYITRWLKQAGEQAFLLTGATGAFDIDDPRLLDFVSERAGLFAKTFNETTAESLLKQIQAGLQANETTEELSDRVSMFYEGEKDFRSERAAKTEASASANFASQDAYQQAGVEKIEWLVVAPEDEDCISNTGVVVEIGKAFPSGDEQPPVHPNCVCTTIPVFED